MGSTRHALYAALVVVHVLAALFAFGAVALSGVYAASARHPQRPGSAEEARRYFGARAVADWVLLAVPLLGLAAVGVGRVGFGRLWVALALTLWTLAALTVFAVAVPARRRVREGLAVLAPTTGTSGGPVPEGLLAAATRLAWAAAVVDAVFVLAVLDMIYKPA